MKKVEVYEAAANLHALLRMVEKGEQAVITRSGKPIADLIPHQGFQRDPREVIAGIRQMRQGVTVGEHSLTKLIGESRS